MGGLFFCNSDKGIAYILYVFTYKFLYNILPETAYFILVNVLNITASVNISLFVFNLLPIPGLDGFWIVRDLKPDLFYKYSGLIDRYGNYIILVVILLGGRLISVPVSGLIRIILNIVTTIVGI